MPASLSIVVAVSEDGVIGRRNDLPWRLSADLRRFKRITMGHHLLMGRKTYESIGRLLPGRTTAILTRSPEYAVEGAIVGTTLETLLAQIDDTDVFVVGGGEIYAATLPMTARLHFTRVHTEVEDGEVFFPPVDWSQWREISTEFQPADEKNEFDSTYGVFERVSGTSKK
jgi:dihydrofolate reductase